jgi:hypothetical protein
MVVKMQQYHRCPMIKAGVSARMVSISVVY